MNDYILYNPFYAKLFIFQLIPFTSFHSCMEQQARTNIFWFRRDLSLFDNHGLFRALKEAWNVLPLFIFDTNILKRLDNPRDPGWNSFTGR